MLELEDLLALAQDQALRWAGAGADRIEAMEARLALYERLARRHRCEPEELLTRYSEQLRWYSRALREITGREVEAVWLYSLRGARAMDVESHYVETFDRGRGTALHLFRMDP